MGKNDLLSEKEVLKKLAKEEKDKKKNKKARRDAWTAVAILATIMLVAVGLSFYKSNNIEIQEYSGRSLAKEQERRETTRNVILGIGVVCAGVLVIALVNRSKNKVEKISPEELHRIEERRLKEARERVEEAKRNHHEEDNKVTITRSNREHMHSASEGHRGHIDGRVDMSSMDMEDRAAYLERRKKEYQYYMENELDDNVEDEKCKDNESSGSGLSKRKKFSWIDKVKPMLPYIIGAVILIAAVIIFIL